MSALLEVRRVRKSFATPRGSQLVLRDVDLVVGAGEFVSLLGHSGCGKSTLLALIAGLSEPDSGELLVDGARIRGPGPERAMVFQSPALLPWLDAAANVRLGVDQAYASAASSERQAIVEHFLDLFGLFDVRHKLPRELSVGMRQRVGVARAFALQPRLLLLDEPFGSLDSLTRAELQDGLVECWSRTRAAALLVTHDVDEALLLSDRVALMTDGPGATIGEVIDVPFRRPRVRTELEADPRLDALRDRVLAFLAATSSRSAGAPAESTVSR